MRNKIDVPPPPHFCSLKVVRVWIFLQHSGRVRDNETIAIPTMNQALIGSV